MYSAAPQKKLSDLPPSAFLPISYARGSGYPAESAAPQYRLVGSSKERHGPGANSTISARSCGPGPADHQRLAQQLCGVMDERQILSPAKFIEMMGLDVNSFASHAHVHRSTVIRAPAAESIQSHIRESLRVLAAAAAASGGDLQAVIFWYRNEPLAPFNYKTAESLVTEGRAADVLNLLESFQAGFVG